MYSNFKALVPFTNKLKDKRKFMLQSLFKTKSTFTVASRLLLLDPFDIFLI